MTRQFTQRVAPLIVGLFLAGLLLGIPNPSGVAQTSNGNCSVVLILNLCNIGTVVGAPIPAPPAAGEPAPDLSSILSVGLGSSSSPSSSTGGSANSDQSALFAVSTGSGEAPLSVRVGVQGQEDGIVNIDFGDGTTGTGTLVDGVLILDHVFNEPGTYFITLNMDGQTVATVPVTVLAPVTSTGGSASGNKLLGLGASTGLGEAPLNVLFDVVGTDGENFLLDFGDGTSFLGLAPALDIGHIFDDAGLFNVRLLSGPNLNPVGGISIDVRSPGQVGTTTPGSAPTAGLPTTSTQPATSFAGEASGVKARVDGQSYDFGATPAIPASGGTRQINIPTIEIPGVLKAENLRSEVNASGSQVRVTSAVDNLVLTLQGNNVTAKNVEASATSTCVSGASAAEGTSRFEELVVNGQQITLSGEPNLVLPIVGGKIIFNEQQRALSSTATALTVTAIHIIVGNGDDMMLAAVRVGLGCHN